MLCLHCTMPDGSSAQHPFWLWEAGFYLWFSVGSPTRQRNKKARPPQSLLVMGDVGISRCPQSLRYSCHGHGNGTESAIPCWLWARLRYAVLAFPRRCRAMVVDDSP